jgi:hypothetical protein
MNGLVCQCLEGEGSDKALRGFGHYDMHRNSVLRQARGQLTRFVGRNAATNTKNNGFALHLMEIEVGLELNDER